MLFHKIKSKKGQGAETMTWIVATIIILIITFLFLLAISLLSKEKRVSSSFGETGIFGAEYSSVATQQMLFSFLSFKHSSSGKDLKTLIHEKDYNLMRKVAEEGIAKFKEQGIICNFFVKDPTKGGSILKLNNGASGTKREVFIDGKEAILECEE